MLNLIVSKYWCSNLTQNRLRDISQETEQEQRRRISEMEHDVATLDELQSVYTDICYIQLI